MIDINNSFKYNISITEKYDNDETLDEKYKFILDNVGLGFDENNERIFAVLLKELSELHPEMQKRFSVYELKKKTYIDPSYIKSMNEGEWPDPSLFSAILNQIEQYEYKYSSLKPTKCSLHTCLLLTRQTQSTKE